jgi:hypothetical protein
MDRGGGKIISFLPLLMGTTYKRRQINKRKPNKFINICTSCILEEKSRKMSISL